MSYRGGRFRGDDSPSVFGERLEQSGSVVKDALCATDVELWLDQL